MSFSLGVYLVITPKSVLDVFGTLFASEQVGGNIKIYHHYRPLSFLVVMKNLVSPPRGSIFRPIMSRASILNLHINHFI